MFTNIVRLMGPIKNGIYAVTHSSKVLSENVEGQ